MALTDEEKRKIEEEERYRAELKKQLGNETEPKKEEKKGIGCLAWCAIIFIILITLGALISSSSSGNKPPTLDTTNSKKPSINSYINVTRQTIIQALKDYTFKKESELIKGQENYIAKDKVTEIQLLGSSDNLNSASFTVHLTQGTVGDRTVAMTAMVPFAGSVDELCVKWLIEQVERAHDNISTTYSNTEIACGRKLSYFYFPNDSMTFGVQSKE